MRKEDQEWELMLEINSLGLVREVMHFDSLSIRTTPKIGYVADPEVGGHFSEIEGKITLFPCGDPTIPEEKKRKYIGATVVLLYGKDIWENKRDRSLDGYVAVGLSWCSEKEEEEGEGFSFLTGRLIATGRALKQCRRLFGR